MKELLKERFGLWCRKIWLREIHKEIQCRDRYFERYRRSVYVIDKLVHRFNELYPDSRLTVNEAKKK